MASLDSHNVWYHPHQMQVGNLKHDTYTLPKQPWAALFGEARGLDTGSPYDVQSTNTWTMPAAFQGVREMIGQSIERMVFHEGNWHMRVVMPFQKVGDANEVTWNETIFDGHLASPTPELGVVRLVSSKRIQHTASFSRMGMGYFMEHGFMNTRQGVEYHLEHLRQMAQSALETSKFDVVYTLFQYQTVNRQWEIENGRFKRQKVEDVVSERVWMFACLQKYKRAIKVLDIHVNEIMAKYGGRADTWIVPPAIINYFSVAKEEYLSYSIAGPRGPDIAFDNPKPLFPLNGSQVFVSRTYHTSELTGHEDILSKRSEIGEYYLFEDRFSDDHTNYRSKWRHIRIYNEDDNQWFEITPKYVLDHSHLFKQDGTPRYADDNPLYEHHVDGRDGSRDIWEYGDQNGMHKAQLFGEMVPDYFSANDKNQFADTVLAALRHDYSEGLVTDMLQNLNRGMDLVRRIENIRYKVDDSQAKKWKALLDTTNIESKTPTGLKSVFTVKHVPSDSATGFSKITGDIVELLPGMQSYAGLKLLVEQGDKATLESEIDIARKFIAAIEMIVDNLRKYLPNSVFTSRNYASSWWHHARDATTFFENLLLPSRVPMFVSTGAARSVSITADTARARWERNVLAIVNAIAADTGAITINGPDIDELFTAGGAVEDGVDLKRESFVILLAAIVGRLVREPGQDQVDDLSKALDQQFGNPLRISRESRTQLQMITEVVQLMIEFEDANAGTFEHTTKKTLVDTFRNMADKYERAWKNYESSTAASSFEGDSSYARTTILASPVYLASLAEAKQGSVLLPADPDFPEVLMSAARLEAATRHSDERNDITDIEREIARTLAHQLNPAFVDMDISEHSIRASTLVNHALATQLGHSIDVSESVGFQAEDDEPLEPVAVELLELASETIGDARSGALDQVAAVAHTKRALGPVERKIHGVLSRMMSETFATSYNEVNRQASSPLHRAIALAFMGTPIHRNAFDRFVHHNLVLPISAVICRPHMTYSMLCMIKCLAGPEMGVTLIKDGRFEIQDDAATHAHLGTYIYYSKAIVKNPKHVFVAQEVFTNGYLGGTGVRPINPAVYQAGEGDPNGESIVVIAKPYNNPVRGLFSLTGRLTLGEFEDYDLAEDGRLLFDTCRRYNGYYGWNQARLMDDFDKGPFDGIAEHVYNNVLCHQGHTFYVDPGPGGSFRWQVEVGKGHFGKYTYINCNEARQGRLVEFEEPRWENQA